MGCASASKPGCTAPRSISHKHCPNIGVRSPPSHPVPLGHQRCATTGLLRPEVSPHRPCTLLGTWCPMGHGALVPLAATTDAWASCRANRNWFGISLPWRGGGALWRCPNFKLRCCSMVCSHGTCPGCPTAPDATLVPFPCVLLVTEIQEQPSWCPWACRSHGLWVPLWGPRPQQHHGAALVCSRQDAESLKSSRLPDTEISEIIFHKRRWSVSSKERKKLGHFLPKVQQSSLHFLQPCKVEWSGAEG